MYYLALHLVRCEPVVMGTPEDAPVVDVLGGDPSAGLRPCHGRRMCARVWPRELHPGGDRTYIRMQAPPRVIIYHPLACRTARWLLLVPGRQPPSPHLLQKAKFPPSPRINSCPVIPRLRSNSMLAARMSAAVPRSADRGEKPLLSLC